MTVLASLLENNKIWVNEIYGPGTVERNSGRPTYLWIGCCDGPYEISFRLGLVPNELFIHRNLANLIDGTDASCLGTLQYAIDTLKVRHIIVCGHSRCRGVLAAMDDESFAATDRWLSQLVDFSQSSELDGSAIDDGALARLCARNVRRQVLKLCHTQIVRDAWRRARSLTVHGWIHDDDRQLFHALIPDVRCVGDIESQTAIENARQGGPSRVKEAQPSDTATA